MFYRLFFQVSWVIQLLVGVGLFTVSLLIENVVMQAFLSTSLLALGLVITLETGKAVSIVWYRYMIVMTPGEYPFLLRIASWIFRAGLVLLSMVCSLLFLSDHLDRPNLDTLRDSELTYLEKSKNDEITRLDSERNQSFDEVNSRHQAEREVLRSQHDVRISGLEADLKQEMDNVVNGTFIGARYKELERLISNTKARYVLEGEKLAARQHKERKSFSQVEQTKFDDAFTAVREKFDSARQQLQKHDYVGDERVSDPRINAFLKTFASIFDWEIQPLQLVFAFSLLISLLMEIGIFIAFDTATLALMPILKVHHEERLETETLKSKMSSEIERDETLHDSELHKVRQRADRTMHEAESMLHRFRSGSR